MSRITRILIGVASVLLLTVNMFPVWHVRLTAPQYPEGLGMYIRLNTVTGATPTDLENINRLNHYIGMQRIEPDAIPELKYMPRIVIALAIAGLLAAVLGRRTLLYAWFALFAGAAIAGLADFWRWEYSYGHNLDAATAVIVIPGMSYQPPLIGSKQLLNFTATSWPALGGMIAGLAFALTVLAVALSLVRRRQQSAAGDIAATPVPLRSGLHPASPIVRMCCLLFALCVAFACARPARAQDTLRVSPAGGIRTLGDAVRRAAPGAHIVVSAGVYREPTIVVDKPLTIDGSGDAILDGEGKRQIMYISADSVRVRGLHFRNVGVTFTEDRAALRVESVHDCEIENNVFDDAFFGIYLARVGGCRIAHNVLRAAHTSEGTSGNGIHLWSSRDITIEDNRISGFRDGMYFEFARGSTIRGNTSVHNLRYGLHFMYSDSCRYVRNTFRGNGSGVAVMFTHYVEMTGNTFEQNWGSAAYGLLLKEIYDSRLVGNSFLRNTTALFADGANRLVVEDNTFWDNGWGVRLMASSQNATFARNNFVGNTFDVSTNSRETTSSFKGNFWDKYTGYDLDHDGFGDVPHRPVRLFSLLVEQNPPALILLRSLFVGLLDAAERVMPALTPEMLMDDKPSMRAFK